MKKKSFLVLTTGLISAVGLSIGAVFVTNAGQLFSGFASGNYSCDLPNEFVEISTLNQRIIDSAKNTNIANPYSFRGTITKRIGDVAFIQRVNQTTYELDAISIKGLDTYGNDLAEGNVVDFSGGELGMCFGTPTYFLTGTTNYTVEYVTNPFGYTEPVEYEGAYDWFYNYINAGGTVDNIVANRVSELVQVNGVLPDSFESAIYIDSAQEDYFYYGRIVESTVNEMGLTYIVSTHDEDALLEIYNKFAEAKTNGMLINMRAVSYYHNNTLFLLINSPDDITAVAPYVDYSIVDTRRSMNLYIGSLTEVEQLPVYFLKGSQYEDIPYVNAQQFLNLANGVLFGQYSQRYLSKYCFLQEQVMAYYNDTFGEYDFYYGTDKFTVYSKNGNVDQFARRTSTGVNYLVNGGEAAYCQIDETLSSTKVAFTDEIEYDLGQYGIDIVKDCYNNILVPLVTLGHVVYGINGAEFVYNGKDYYYFNTLTQNNDTQDIIDYKNAFYDDTPWATETTRSQAYANYIYGDLCFEIDYCYGLCDIRGVTSIDTYFTSVTLGSGKTLKDLISSTNNDDYEQGIAIFAGHWLYDGHAQYWKMSPFGDHSENRSDYVNTYSYYAGNNARSIQLNGTHDEMDALRGSNGPGLYVYNDTAVIRFDSFVKYRGGDSKDIADALYADPTVYDYSTLASAGTDLLFRRAFYEIEANPAIKNVVFDLSLNGGGEVDVIPFLMAYCSAQPRLAFYNEVRGEVSENYFKVDINYDGVFDSNDTYEGQYSFYCLDSRYSFSCGNFFPTLLKGYGMAETIGENSGGGVCAVGALGTAAGTLLRNSSLNQLGFWSTVQNKFVSYEDGVPADASLAHEYYYNLSKVREAILTLK